ncbi:MAG: hypothetical protein ABJC61_05750 [Acidobacteriota bacterium]
MAHTEPHSGGHEPDFVAAKPLAGFLVSMAVALILIGVVMWGVFRLLARDARSLDRPLPGNVAQSLRRLPPYPRLEDRPLAPRARLNAEENARLNTFGWVDKPSTVHIPIDLAIDIVARQGIEATPPAAAGSAAGAVPPVEPTPPEAAR